MGQWGAYAQFARANANQLAAAPKSIDFTAAAAIPTAGLTAWQALFDQAGLQAGQSVLINGGAGGVGSYGLQFAKAAGIRVAATCSAGNRAYLQALGCDRVIDYRSEDIAAAVHAWAPAGVDVVIDAVSHGTLPQAFDLLKPGGTLVSIATLNGDGDIAGDMAAAAARGMQKKFAVMNPTVGHAQYAQIAALIDSGKVRSPVLEVYPWEQVALAHERVAAGHVRGKVVLSIEPALGN
jgi:NADPH2:quinone reductase